jgi:hypothetical protein
VILNSIKMGIPIGPRRRLLYELERSSSRKGNGSSVQVHSAFDNIIRTLREFVEYVLFSCKSY